MVDSQVHLSPYFRPTQAFSLSERLPEPPVPEFVPLFEPDPEYSNDISSIAARSAFISSLGGV